MAEVGKRRASQDKEPARDTSSESRSSSTKANEADTPARFPFKVIGQHQKKAEKMPALLLRLEQELQMPVFCFVQSEEDGPTSSIDFPIWLEFVRHEKQLPDGSIALLLNSPGGSASYAYRIARLLQRHCGEFIVVVPHSAKSAATLLALGATKIIFSRIGELGPLDVQISDPEMEKEGSGLDEVQSLERMNQASIQMMDQVMMLLLKRSGKRISTLLPQVMSFVATLMRPMLEKLDTVHYTQTARQLQIGSEYAKRLLKTSFPPEKAINIAESLVGNYPDHDFVIDCREAKDLGLPAEQAEGEVAQILEECFPLLFLGNTMIGFADSTGG